MRFKGLKKIFITCLLVGACLSFFNLSEVHAAEEDGWFGYSVQWWMETLQIIDTQSEIIERLEGDLNAQMQLAQQSMKELDCDNPNTPNKAKCDRYREWIGKSSTKQADVIDEINKPYSSPNEIANFVGWILFWVASFFSKMVGWLVDAMVYVATYNDFLNHNIVKTGWQIVRDVCNNFFIVGLLIISVATILRQPASYQYQQALGKLLVMAVLINFSKLFTGILIDVSQVITIYFANALAANGGNVILFALGLYNLYQVDGNGGVVQGAAFDNYGSAISALLYALILSVIAAVVIACITIVLVYRIVTLWFLVILSPAAFLAKAIPGQEKYFSEWMSTLSKELIVAPVMLFFLYLSLFAGAINIADADNPNSKNPTVTGTRGQSGAQVAQDLVAASGTNTSAPSIINFLLIIGLLVGSLVAGQRVGAKGSSWAGAGVAKLDSWRKEGKAWVVDKPVNLATDFGKYTAKSAADKVWSGTKSVGIALNAASGGRLASVVSGARRGAAQVPGIAGAGATGAAVGAAVGSFVPVLGTAIGAAVGGALGGGFSTYLRASSNRRQGRIDDQQAIGAAEQSGDGGEYRDENGNKITEIDAQSAASLGKRVYRYNESRGVYAQAHYDGTNWANQLERDRDANGDEQVHQTAGVNTTYLGEQYLDSTGTPTATATAGGYQWDGSKYAKIKNTNVERLRDDTGKVISRYGEVKLSDGNTYRRLKENGEYYQVNDKGEIIDNATKTAVSDAVLMTSPHLINKAQINKLSGIGKEEVKGGAYGANTISNRVRDAWYASSDKGRAAKEAAEMERVSKLQKDYDGLDKELLQRLLKQEGDLMKRQAISLALAVKDGFKDAGMVDAAKQNLQMNRAMLKSFNDSMNKKNLILNHTRADGTLDESGIRKAITSGKASWTDQDLKAMPPEAFALMAQMRGDKFESDLDTMIKTTADKGVVAKALSKNINNRSFTGTDFAMRRAYAVHSSDLSAAFTDSTGAVNHGELAKAVKRISNPVAFAGFDVTRFNQPMKEAMVEGMNFNHFYKMSTNDKIGPAKLGEYVAMVQDVEATAPVGSAAQTNATKIIRDIRASTALQYLIP